MSVDPVDAGHSHRLIEAKRLLSKITGMFQSTGTVVANDHAELTWDRHEWLVYNETTFNVVYAGRDLSDAVDVFITLSSIP